MRILSVVGARPNFVKAAPIARALAARQDRFEHRLVHTGQHYDGRMSDAFFADLNLPEPDYHLGVGSGGHAHQTAAVMLGLEPVLEAVAPDLVLVVGDVNSTLAAALTAKKLGIAVAHVEAGLRSGDMTMPEEINRRCVDAISDILFTTDRLADENLARENPPGRIVRVGNVMIDTLLDQLPAARALDMPARLGLPAQGYGVLTLHRPANVENRDTLADLLDAVRAGAGDLPVVFPIHPRTRGRIEAFGLADRLSADPRGPGLFATEPLGYREFLGLIHGARVVMTDSGGLQEETTVLGVPCVTLRETTERPITVLEGGNRIAGVAPPAVRAAIAEALDRRAEPRRPALWDGHAAERIADVLCELYPF